MSAPDAPLSSVPQIEQRALLRRIDMLVRWMKREFAYRGSKDTGDFAAMVAERLIRQDDYRATFTRQPALLRGLLSKLVRHVMIDALRGENAHRRKRPPIPVVREWAEQLRADSGLESSLYRDQRLRLLYDELGRFERGEGAERFRSRTLMLQALELHREGRSHAEIAEALDQPKSTIGHWLEILTLHLARRIAEREAGMCARRAKS